MLRRRYASVHIAKTSSYYVFYMLMLVGSQKGKDRNDRIKDFLPIIFCLGPCRDGAAMNYFVSEVDLGIGQAWWG